MTEADIENAYVRWCGRQGYAAYKLTLDARKGWPDRTVYLGDGRVVHIEFKKPGGRTSKQQDKQIAELKKQGYRVLVTDDLEEARNFTQKEAKQWQTKTQTTPDPTGSRPKKSKPPGRRATSTASRKPTLTC